jgi:hypothetical protein
MQSSNQRWATCGANNGYFAHHEYGSYINQVGQRVCYICDPLGYNNRHRPSAQQYINFITQGRGVEVESEE